MRLYLLLACLAGFAAAENFSYRDYKVFRLYTKSEEDLRFFYKLVKSDENYGPWTYGLTDLPSIVVPPHKVPDFEESMKPSGIKYEMVIEDMQAMIDHQVNGGSAEKGFGWKRYHTVEEIDEWMDTLPQKYPDKVEIVVGGRSYENRKIRGVKISSGCEKPGIFIEGGIHAYEWMSPAMATYVINELLTSEDAKIRGLVESYDWYIFPMLNPDGFIYSRTHNRFWRKSTSPNPNSKCIGTDLNLNWDSAWNKVGTSNDSCSYTYAGTHPFSEIETKTMSEYIKSIGDKLFAYITFHSYSQLLLVPYGYTKEHLDNYEETYAIGVKAVEALARRYGTEYQVTTAAESLFLVSGMSIDWVKETLKLPLVYQYEFRDKKYALLLPPEEIIPNGQEVMDSIVAMFEEARKYGYPKSRPYSIKKEL